MSERVYEYLSDMLEDEERERRKLEEVSPDQVEERSLYPYFSRPRTETSPDDWTESAELLLRNLVDRERERARKAGRQGGRETTAKAAALRQRVRDAADEIRRAHPYDREHSTRWLALRISRTLREPKDTVRGHLRRLGLR